MQLNAASQNAVEPEMHEFECLHRKTVSDRPKEKDLAVGLEDTAELCEKAIDIRLGEMFHETQIVESVEGPVRNRQRQQICVNDARLAAMTSGVARDSDARDIDRGDAESPDCIVVDLSPATTCVEQGCAGREMPGQKPVEAALDDVFTDQAGNLSINDICGIAAIRSPIPVPGFLAVRPVGRASGWRRQHHASAAEPRARGVTE